MTVLRARTLSLPGALVDSTAQSPVDLAPADEQVRRLTTDMAHGHRGALAEIFAMRCTLVEREVARSLGHRSDLVPDAAQEAWLRVARSPVACPGSAALDAWLRRVAATAAIDLLRADLARRAREQRVARDRGEARAFVDDSAQLDAARALLAALPAADRSLLELRARTGATLAQLAAALGIGPAAVDSRLRRAVERARSTAQEKPS